MRKIKAETMERAINGYTACPSDVDCLWKENDAVVDGYIAHLRKKYGQAISPKMMHRIARNVAHEHFHETEEV